MNPEFNPAELTILVIDDNADMRNLFAVVLRRAKYKVELAKDGEQGLELAKANLPDLILCDIMMPGIDGREVFAELRKHSPTATIPFIFLTALGSTEDIFTGLRLGADDYLVKPVKAETLLHSVETRLLKHQRIQFAQMQGMMQRLLQTREHERQRVAQRLDHDIHQNLLGLKLSLGLLEDKENPALQAEVMTAINQAIEQVEKLTQELRPSVLDHIGLVAGIRWLLQQYKLNVSFVSNELEFNLEPEIKHVLIRTLQEALDNVAAHAQTDAAVIDLRYSQETMSIVLTDMGAGFDLEEVLGSAGMGGLMRMQELLATIGGNLTITSSPGNGTVIYIKVQVETQASTEPDMQNIMRSLIKSQHQMIDGFSSQLRITLVIAIEQNFLRQGMMRLLANIPQLRILAECDRLADLDATIAKHKPDLLIVNPIRLAGNEFQHELVSQIVQNHKDLHILMVGANREKEYALNAVNNGAHGYIPYNTTLNDLYTAISATARGELYVSPEIVLDTPSA